MSVFKTDHPFTNKIQYYLPQFTSLAGILTTTTALSLYAYVGFFSRYYADDFCLSGMLFQQGFWRAQVTSYVTWSNRYAGMFLVALSELFGHASIRYWTLLAIVLGVASLSWMFYQIIRLLNLPLSKIHVLLLAELALFFTLIITPQLYQVLFWRIGLVTYTLPLVILAIIAGLVIRLARRGHPASWAGLAGTGLLAFFAGGLSETALSLQITLILLGMLLAFLVVKDERRRGWMTPLGSALAGSLAAALAVISAPGNASRLAFMPEPPGFLALLPMVARNAFIFMYDSLQEHFFAALLAVLAPMLLVYLLHASGRALPGWSPSRVILAILVMPPAGYLLIAAVVAPAAYAQSSYPDGRVLVGAGFILVMVLLAEGLLLGVAFSLLHRYANEAVPAILQVAAALVLLVALIYPAYDVVRTSRQVGEFKTYAQAWDARDARIRAARGSGAAEVQEKAYNAPGGLSELSTDSENWVNACAAWFYDLQSIHVGGP